MNEINKNRIQSRMSLLSLTPCAIFILIVALMTGVSELTSEPEIIFPEAAAIALGALIAPGLPWKVNKISALMLVFICAVAGLTISRYVLLPLEYKLIIAYITGLFFYTFFGTSFAPIISAAVLPVLMNTRSLIYIAAAVSLTALVLVARYILERAKFRSHERAEIMPLPGAGHIAEFIFRSAVVTIVCIFAIKTGFKFLVCPPLLVAFTEFTVHGNKALRSPVGTFSILTLCATAGTLARLLCSVAGAPLTLAALLTGIIVAAAVYATEIYLPPAAAIAILAMLLPSDALPSYPLQIAAGALLYLLFGQVSDIVLPDPARECRITQPCQRIQSIR